MRIVFIQPVALWFLLIIPAVCRLNIKLFATPTLIVPNVRMIQMLAAGKTRQPKQNMLIFFRLVAIALLIISCARPMIILETAVVACGRWLVLFSFVCFSFELLLRHTVFVTLP